MVITLSMWPPRRRPNTTGSRPAPKPFINDSPWKLIKGLFPKARKSAPGGRPPVDSRICLEGIIRVLKTVARWQDVPERSSSSTTCRRRHKQWTEDGIIQKAWQRLLRRMDRRKLLHWSQAMGDGTFSPAKRGVDVGKTRRGKGRKVMLVVDGQGIPVSMFVTSAQIAEVKTIETLFDIRRCGSKVKCLPYDKATDADWLRDSMEERGAELICPHRRGRKRKQRQDGRSLRRYRHRWSVE